MFRTVPMDAGEERIGDPEGAAHGASGDGTARLRRAARERIEEAWAGAQLDFSEVRDVVLLCSSSRSGSSVLAHTLRLLPGLRHLRAEVNPWLRMVGLSSEEKGTDALGASDAVRARALQRLWGLEVGRPAPLESSSSDDLARAFFVRLTLQWPSLDLSLDEVRRAVDAVRPEADTPIFMRVLEHLATRHPHLDLRRYDRAGLPEPEPHPLRGPLIEETPFVTIGGWAPVGDPEVPLVLKAPSNAYRLPFYQALFPNARLRVLHLTRNPAAAINGLISGWGHWGFFSHRSAEPRLDIDGYTDRFPAWGRSWWKFDLPPGWETVRERPLAEVCAFQWSAAHRHILDFLEGQPAEVDHLRVRFEDFQRGEAGREAVLSAIGAWLELPGASREVAQRTPPPVMVTGRPTPGRWRTRRREIAPLLASPAIRDLSAALGYHDEHEFV